MGWFPRTHDSSGAFRGICTMPKTDVVTKKIMMFHCHFTHPQTTPGNITFSQSQAGMVTINQLYLMKSHTDAILLVLHLNIITVALLHKSLQSAMSPFLYVYSTLQFLLVVL